MTMPDRCIKISQQSTVVKILLPLSQAIQAKTFRFMEPQETMSLALHAQQALLAVSPTSITAQSAMLFN